MASQTSLSSFFGKRTNPDSESSPKPKKQRVETPSSAPSSPDVGKVKAGTPKTKRTWRTDWEKKFPWLLKNEEDGQIRATCAWCTDARKTNPFARTGSGNLQYSAFCRHETNPEHLLVLDGRRAKEKKKTMPIVIEQIIDNHIDSQNDDSKQAQFLTMYYLAKEGQPLTQFNNLIELQQRNNCAALQDTNKLYTSVGKQREILDAINESVEDSINADIHHSPFHGIILDETTDVTVFKKLNVYFQCLRKSDNQPVVHFVDCVSVHDGRAETLISAIVELCERLGLDTGKITTMASDGASVMTGRHNGVGARFRDAYSPRLIQIHCVAHRLSLAAGQACRDNTLFNDYQRTWT